MKRLIAKPDGNHVIVELSAEEIAEITAEKDARQERLAIIDNKETAQQILNSTDWTQLSNSGLTEACVVEFANYRSAIRQIRMSDQAVVDWPEKPSEQWA